MPNYISELDTWRFGFKIARVNEFDNHPDEIIRFLKEKGVKLVISRIPLRDIHIINALENLGFEYKDIQLNYRFYYKNLIQLNLETRKDSNIRTFKEQDVGALMGIAGEVFRNHGHYFADDRLDRSKCSELYMDWIKNCCTDRNVADIVFVAEKDSEIMGFLSYKVLSDEKNQYSRTILGGVKKIFQKKGVYTSLLYKGFSWGAELKLEYEDHFVSANNIAINHVFNKLGLKLNDSFITLHGWLQKK